jgi:hypothetical protein
MAAVSGTPDGRWTRPIPTLLTHCRSHGCLLTSWRDFSAILRAGAEPDFRIPWTIFLEALATFTILSELLKTQKIE